MSDDVTAWRKSWAAWESERVIRGIEVKVFADSFDRSPGIPYGPQEVWAQTFEGDAFELTQAEEEKIASEAAESRLSDYDPTDY
jgi:hypothetical protein